MVAADRSRSACAGLGAGAMIVAPCGAVGQPEPGSFVQVSFFATCLINELDAGAGLAGARLLRGLGVDVAVPPGQTCCGQPAFNAGHHVEARRVARYTVGVLESSDWVVLPSGSCTAMIRHHYHALLSSARGRDDAAEQPDGDLAARAARLASRTFELAEFIVDVLGIEQLGDGLAGRRIAYHHGCHALRELGLRDEPLRLLRNAGATIVDWEAAEECCGFGGLFAVRMPEVSAAMADRKLDTLLVVQPDILTSADGGCLLQLGGRSRRRGLDIPVRHLAHLLLEATGAPA